MAAADYAEVVRPNLLDPLFTPVSRLPGIGPKRALLFDRLLGAGEGRPEARVLDLLFHLPTGFVDRRLSPKIADAEPGAIVTLRVVIDGHRPGRPGNSRAPYRIDAHDESGSMSIVFFHAKNQRRLAELFPTGAEMFVSGRLERYGDLPQIVHPDHAVPVADAASLPRVEPVYPLVAGLFSRPVGKAVEAALDRVPELPEWLDPALVRQRRWPGFAEALRTAHAPDSAEELDPTAPARMRLAYDELLAGQIALALVRKRLRRPRGRAFVGDGRLRSRIIDALPFALTGSQAVAVDEIVADLASPERMLRLLQGDVGSGKTIVALLTMAAAVEAGAQAALMAPTEILARQHHRTIAPLAEAAGLRIGLLTGRDRGRERDRILADLASGEIDIAVGTHALVQEAVAFKDLALAVVDEQHRFGVHQRLALSGKGDGVDLLVMTATPIPRTLELTAFGDMDVSKLLEKPAGRQPIDTKTVSLERIDEVVAGLGRALANGARIYWICPLVEDSEVSDLAAAGERYTALSAHFGPIVGLAHGKMPGRERDREMARFASGETRILVATTVVEVGVDVPEATVIVIEHAERFGLAQLHQLRGRVGRGREKSTCLLLYRGPLGETARARLQILRETEDGFRIAEEDLRLRGAGDLLGTRQSGLAEMKVADLSRHGDLLAIARDDARLTLDRNPRLEGDRGSALRLLLSIFEKRDAVRLLESG